VIKLDDAVIGRQLVLDFFAGDDLAVAFYQYLPDLEGLLLQQNPILTPAQFSGLQIEFKDSDANARWQRVLHGVEGETFGWYLP